MPEVRRRKTYLIKNKFTAPNISSFVYSFRDGFDADDMIVKSWVCASTTASGLLIMNMSSIGDLFHFEQSQSNSPKNIFNVNQYIKGDYTFTVKQIDGTDKDLTDAEVGFVIELIEFVK
jgi:hypothetical protein